MPGGRPRKCADKDAAKAVGRPRAARRKAERKVAGNPRWHTDQSRRWLPVRP